MIFISVLRIVSLWFPPLRTPVVTQMTGMVGQLAWFHLACLDSWRDRARYLRTMLRPS